MMKLQSFLIKTILIMITNGQTGFTTAVLLKDAYLSVFTAHVLTDFKLLFVFVYVCVSED